MMRAKHIHNLPRQHAHPQRAEIKIAVRRHHRVDIFIQSRMIDPPARQPQRQNGGLHVQRVMIRQRKKGLSDCPTVAVGNPAHHAEIKPDDFAVAHPDIAGMRISMKITVLDNLLDVVLSQTPPQLVHIETLFAKRFRVVESYPVHILHHENPRRGQMMINLRTFHIFLARV